MAEQWMEAKRQRDLQEVRSFLSSNTGKEGRREQRSGPGLVLSLSCLVWSCLVWSGLVWSALLLSCLVWSGLVWSCLVLSGLVWSCLVLSCLVLSGLVFFKLNLLLKTKAVHFPSTIIPSWRTIVKWNSAIKKWKWCSINRWWHSNFWQTHH